MDGTLVDTEPYWIEAEFELAEKHGGTWSREHALNLVGNDLIDSGRYIREHMGIDARAGRDRRGAARRRRRPGGARSAVAARCAWSCWPTCAPRRAVRAGDDVLPAVRGADAGRRCRRATFSDVVTGDAVARQAPSGALPEGRRAPRRAAGGLPGDRGLQHRSPLRRRPPAAPCSSCRTTCRCSRAKGGSSRTRWPG